MTTDDKHSRHFHEKQEDLLRRFHAIQRTILACHEAAAREAAADMQDSDPIVAKYARLRLDWNTRAADELRARMEAGR